MSDSNSRDAQAAQTRAHILDTALELFAERGFKGTSTRRIAQKAGVSEGLIFHHFKRKRDLLAGIGEARGVLAQQVVALVATAHGLSVEMVVPAIASRYVDMLLSDDVDARLFQVMLAESRTDPELQALFRETSEQVISALEAYLQARQRAGELRPDLACRAAAQTLLGGFLWFFLTGAHEGAEDPRAATTRFTEEVVAFWMQGARSPE